MVQTCMMTLWPANADAEGQRAFEVLVSQDDVPSTPSELAALAAAAADNAAAAAGAAQQPLSPSAAALAAALAEHCPEVSLADIKVATLTAMQFGASKAADPPRLHQEVMQSLVITSQMLLASGPPHAVAGGEASGGSGEAAAPAALAGCWFGVAHLGAKATFLSGVGDPSKYARLERYSDAWLAEAERAQCKQPGWGGWPLVAAVCCVPF